MSGSKKEDMCGEKRTPGNPWITIVVVCIRLPCFIISFPHELSFFHVIEGYDKEVCRRLQPVIGKQVGLRSEGSCCQLYKCVR